MKPDSSGGTMNEASPVQPILYRNMNIAHEKRFTSAQRKALRTRLRAEAKVWAAECKYVTEFVELILEDINKEFSTPSGKPFDKKALEFQCRKANIKVGPKPDATVSISMGKTGVVGRPTAFLPSEEAEIAKRAKALLESGKLMSEVIKTLGLGVHPKTVRRLIRQVDLKAKKDSMPKPIKVAASTQTSAPVKAFEQRSDLLAVIMADETLTDAQKIEMAKAYYAGKK